MEPPQARHRPTKPLEMSHRTMHSRAYTKIPTAQLACPRVVVGTAMLRFWRLVTLDPTGRPVAVHCRPLIARAASLLLLGTSAAACDRAPPEPASAPEISDRSEREPSPSDEPTAPTCQVAMPNEPPPSATSVDRCPSDPDGRPTMPRGKLRFPGGAELDVEIADNDPDRSHGLMFRPTLSDSEGMLFSWTENAMRSFWMRNTCLALDMLFLDDRGYVLSVLEQVPPWNEAPRRVACPAAHVLEVRAGWTRAHDVKPGQKVDIQSTP